MSEAARLPCPSINRYANINNIIDISEELVQIPICHLERQVAEVQRPRSGPQGPGTAAARILRGYTAALKDLQMHSLDATFGGLNRVKVHVCKPSAQSSVISNEINSLHNAKLLHVVLQIFRRHIVEQITNVDSLSWPEILFQDPEPHLGFLWPRIASIGLRQNRLGMAMMLMLW